MSLGSRGVIEIPGAGAEFDHGAFDLATRRVFVAHTARDRVEVLDHDAGRHLATLEGFPGAAGVVAEAGHVLVTNRSAASLAWLDARSLATRAIFQTAARPNGVALISNLRRAVVACIGNDTMPPALQVIDLAGERRWAIELPGRPRWCVADAEGSRVYVAIRDPSMVLVARLPELTEALHWPLSSAGAHGLDIDHERGFLYAACDGGALVEIDAASGAVKSEWPLDGSPDATFFNPSSGLVHVAIPEPGPVQTVDPRSGMITRTVTAPGAQTTALVPPDRLYVFSPHHRGVLDLVEEAEMLHSGIYKPRP
jgi:DNA-binding beta-propeller fold protein YncE